MSEYDDVMRDEHDEDTLDGPLVSYTGHYDSDRGGFVIEERHTEFEVVILSVDTADVEFDALIPSIAKAREFDEEYGELIDSRLELFGAQVTGQGIPVRGSYIADVDAVGVRVSTEVAGDTYGFECMLRDDSQPDMLFDQFDRFERRVVEDIWNDHVLDSVSLDTGASE